MAKIKENYRRLLSTAKAQQGLFTAKQAKAAGYSEKNHGYHVRTGSWLRLHRGIYRLVDFPGAPQPDLALWALWSRDRAGRPQGVYSHQTVLSHFDLSDVNPARLHMTVPPHFRRNAPIPKPLTLHYASLAAADIEESGACRVTRPMRAIMDILSDGSESIDILAQSLEQGLRRGLIRLNEVNREELPVSLKKVANNFIHRVRHGKSA
jgi:predicted transcriptional regulator of viral defense system